LQHLRLPKKKLRNDSIPLVFCLERSGRQQPSPIIEWLLSIPEVPLRRDSPVQAIHSRKISRPTPYSLHDLRLQRLATIPSIDNVLTQYGNSRGISDIGHSHFSVTNLTVGANTEYISCTRRSISRLIDDRSYDYYVYLPRDWFSIISSALLPHNGFFTISRRGERCH
jgi:hypothetical protein